ncbi:MAG: extracellular solute-binding protein [Chloroflexi bacterium]|nr:extracellular solute-binding protein [Chloroflexota bacterium]
MSQGVKQEMSPRDMSAGMRPPMRSHGVTRRAAAQAAMALAAGGSGAALAACGPFGQPAPRTDNELPVVTLELWGLRLQRHESAYEKILADWHATNPKERVVHQPQPEGLDTKLTAAIAGGTPPEMASRLGHTLEIQIARQWLEPVDHLYRQAKVDPRKHFLPNAWEPWEVKGKAYGVPFEDNAAGWGIGLRTDLFQEAGVRVPDSGFKSWDEVYDVARKLVKREGGEVVRWGFSANAGHIMTWIVGAMEEPGQPFFDRSRGKFQFNTPIGHEVLKKLMWDPARVHNIEEPSLGDPGGPDIYALVHQGKIAMSFGLPGSSVGAARLANLDVAPFMTLVIRPPFREGRELKFIGEGGWGVGVLRHGKNKDRTGPFVTYLMGKGPQLHWSITLGCQIPATPFPHSAPECQPPDWAHSQRIFKVQNKARYWGNDAGAMGNAYGVVATHTRKLRKGEVSVPTAAQLIDDELQVKLDEYKRALAEAEKS